MSLINEHLKTKVPVHNSDKVCIDLTRYLIYFFVSNSTIQCSLKEKFYKITNCFVAGDIQANNSL